jgi:hypothetical protein
MSNDDQQEPDNDWVVGEGLNQDTLDPESLLGVIPGTSSLGRVVITLDSATLEGNFVSLTQTSETVQVIVQAKFADALACEPGRVCSVTLRDDTGKGLVSSPLTIREVEIFDPQPPALIMLSLLLIRHDPG